MKRARQSGFTLMEVLVVVAVTSLVVVLGWSALQGWRERNALRMVSQDVKYLFEKYRQRALDKGYNYGLIFSDDGIYVFEDSGGTGADRFQAINNFAVDPGEYSDRVAGIPGGDRRAARRISSAVNEFKLFSNDNPYGRILVMTMATLDLNSSRATQPYEASGTDISSSAIQPFTGSNDAPFEAGSLALFFSPDGLVYLKDPAVSIGPMERYLYRLGSGADGFYVIRVVWDSPDTAIAELPNYYEIAINRYGATTFVRWETGDDGASWDANVQ